VVSLSPSMQMPQCFNKLRHDRLTVRTGENNESRSRRRVLRKTVVDTKDGLFKGDKNPQLAFLWGRGGKPSVSCNILRNATSPFEV
jgi:hypothetical protein